MARANGVVNEHTYIVFHFEPQIFLGLALIWGFGRWPIGTSFGI